jgi:hypothetical protein
MPTESRRLPKRGVAKNGNKPKRVRRAAKAGSESVDSVTEEGRVAVAPTMPTEAATVAETAEAEKESDLAAETAAVGKEGDVAVEKAPAEKEGNLGHSPSSVQEERTEVTVAKEMAVLFRIIKDLQKLDTKLIVGNTDQEQFEDMYRLAQLSELDREAELAKRHADLQARQEMEAIQEQQRQVDDMSTAVAEQMKRREMEALQSRNQVSFLVQFLQYCVYSL